MSTPPLDLHLCALLAHSEQREPGSHPGGAARGSRASASRDSGGASTGQATSHAHVIAAARITLVAAGLVPGIGFSDGEATQDLGLSAYETVELALPESVTGPVVLSIDIGGIERTVQLHAKALRGEHYGVYLRDEHGTAHAEPTVPSTAVTGFVLDHPESFVAGSVRGGDAWLLVRLSRQDPLWAIEPCLDTAAPAGPRRHLVYSATDVNLPALACGVVAPRGLALGLSTCGLGKNLMREVEIACDSDSALYNKSGWGLSTDNRIEDILAAVSVLYENDVGINYKVGQVYKNTPNTTYSSSDAPTLLTQFKNHWNQSHGSDVRDVAHLFTGLDISLNGSTSYIGYAYIGVVCSPTSAYGLSEIAYTGSNFLSRVLLTAHELGHNWNAVHCDGASDCSIMCSTIGGCSGGSSFDSDSAAAIIAFKLQANCLTDLSANPWANAWASLGGGKPGTLGIPSLGVTGLPWKACALDLTLSQAKPNANGFFRIDYTGPFTPLPTGLRPDRPRLSVPFVTNASGAVTGLSVSLTSLPSPELLWVQAFVSDPLASGGFSASNSMSGHPVIVDSFDGASGTPPDPSVWSIDLACNNPATAVVQIHSGHLRQYMHGDPSCPKHIGAYTGEPFPSFDVSARFVDQDDGISGGVGNGYRSLGVFDASVLPPVLSTPGTSTVAQFNMYGQNNNFGVVWESQGQIHSIVPNKLFQLGDNFRIVGKPGQYLRFYLNGALLQDITGWQPTASAFIGGLYAYGNPGEQVVTRWDDFVMTPAP